MASHFNSAKLNELREELRWLIAYSRALCDCDDCDGRWCSPCLTHHGNRTCPHVTDCEIEIAALTEQLTASQALEAAFAAYWKTQITPTPRDPCQTPTLPRPPKSSPLPWLA